MRLVLFDFDGTLTHRDTLLPFLRFVVGGPRYLLGLCWLAPVLALYAAGLLRNDIAKNIVLRHYLGGLPLARLREAGRRFASEELPARLRPDTMALLRQHVAQGDHCLLVSASLDLYLREWAQAHGFGAVLCSELEAHGERAAGTLRGRNCFGPEKVERVRRWLQEAGREPVEVVAYGDSRGDREMLAFAHRGILVAPARRLAAAVHGE